jgi:hypothetical protein
MGSERQSLIDLRLARTEFRLDVLKLKEQLAALGVGGSGPKNGNAATEAAPSAQSAGERRQQPG